MSKYNPVKKNEQTEHVIELLRTGRLAELLNLHIEQPQLHPNTLKTYEHIGNDFHRLGDAISIEARKKLADRLGSIASRGQYCKTVAALKYAAVSAVVEVWAIVENAWLSAEEKKRQTAPRLRKAQVLALALGAHTKPAVFAKVVSKRQENRTLAKDWYTQFTARVAAQTSKYRPHLLIATLAGTRPVEFTIENGVQVFFDNHTIKIRTVGAKQKVAPDSTQLAGQPWRYIVFDLNDPKIAADPAIIELLKYKPELGTVYQPPLLHQKGEGGLRGYDAACNRAGEGLLKHGRTKADKGLFSGYNLRQAFASRMKASGLSQADISRSLGHVSEKTKQYYGFASSRNAGGVSPSAVASAITPRVSKGVMHSMKSKTTKSKTRAAPRFRP